jgi:SET domain
MDGNGIDPNTFFQLENDRLVLTASRDIKEEEQITFNYCTTEWSMATPFKCLCGCQNCFGYISGFSNIPKERRSELIPILLPSIRERALREGLIKKEDLTS